MESTVSGLSSTLWKNVTTRSQEYLVRNIAEQCIPISSKTSGLSNEAYDTIINAIGDQVQVVMIGEASHGTHEFYKMRADLTKRLIQERGFNMVCCEADWPDMTRVNRWVSGRGSDKSAEEALGDFVRFPRWMWRNDVVVEFLDWLRAYNNEQQQRQRQVSMHGLDVYSLNSSMEEVVRYLENVDPKAAEEARDRYSCFDEFGSTPQSYARKIGIGIRHDCSREVIEVLANLVRKSSEYSRKGSKSSEPDGEDALYYAQQNATIVRNAERYYAAMLEGREQTWNLRDQHMCDTLASLLQWRADELGPRKAVVWAHNSHLGDARYTYMKKRGKVNVGQLARERFGMDATFNIGFTTYTGAVTAADNWGQEPKFKRVNKGMKGSLEELMHDVALHMYHRKDEKQEREYDNEQTRQPARHHATFTPDFLLLFRGNNPHFHGELHLVSSELHSLLAHTRLERAIGVIYRPDTERISHYFDAQVSNQFDCLLHVDRTRALHPLEKQPQWIKAFEKEIDVPDTFPYAL